jgi:hypothetical protein
VDGEFVPSKKYLLQQELSQERSEKKRGPVPTESCRRLFAGATYLLSAIGEKLGVERDLKACFPQQHKEILSLVYYLALEPDTPLYRFGRWAHTHKHPYGEDIPSQRSSDLLPLIKEGQKMEFLRRQAKRRGETEYLFYDSTSISSYSEQMKQVKYGKSKESDGLAQINLALLFGQKSSLPAYYRKLPGNITDVMTVDNLIAGADYLDIKKVMLVMDRGYYSEKNLNELMKNHYKFIIGAKISLKFIQAQLAGERADFDRRERYNAETGLFIKTQAMEWDYEEVKPRSGEVISEKRRVYVHIYYNDQHATDDKIRFNKRLDMMEDDIRGGKMSAEREKECRRYYDIKTTPVRGVSFIPKQDAIDKRIEFRYRHEHVAPVITNFVFAAPLLISFAEIAVYGVEAIMVLETKESVGDVPSAAPYDFADNRGKIVEPRLDRNPAHMAEYGVKPFKQAFGVFLCMVGCFYRCSEGSFF